MKNPLEVLKDTVIKPFDDEYIHINMYDSILINPQLLGEKLMNINDMDDVTLYNFVLNNYALILDYIFNNTDRKKYMGIFLNERFLQNLCKIAEKYNLDIIHRNGCNKIIFEALRYNKYATDTRKNLLIKLGILINREEYNILLGLRVPSYISLLLITARYYTPDMWVNVKHFNEIITLCEPPILEEQQLVDIYSRMFDRMTPLVIGVMFDTERTNMSSIEREVDSLISLVMLDLLESMTSNNIRAILIEYTRVFHETGLPYKFSMTTLSSDYSRIVNVVNQLHGEGIIVP